MTGIRGAISRGMFNDDQNSHMDWLDKQPRENLCDCGWEKRGQCRGECFGNAEKGGMLSRNTGSRTGRRGGEE